MKYLYSHSTITKTEDETLAFGWNLKSLLPEGSVVLLVGDLGSGKTTLVKGFASRLGIKEKVLSPTFNILKLYFDGICPLVHIDAYRLEDNNVDIGLDEYIGIISGYTFIEWPEYISSLIDYKSAIKIELKILEDNSREITINSNVNIFPGDI